MTKCTNKNVVDMKPGAQRQPEWVIDLSDASMTVNHVRTGLAFWFEKNGDLDPVVDFSGGEDHPDFEENWDEATQIAKEIAAEEWQLPAPSNNLLA